MFAEGNTDRFGEQIYPVNPPLNVPGPGQYDGKTNVYSKIGGIMSR